MARIALLVVIAAGATTLGVRSLQQWRHRVALRELGDSLRSYTECLLGKPLAPGETAVSRLRRIEAGVTEASSGAAADRWPLACSVDLDRAHATIVGRRALAHDPAARTLDALILRARVDPSPADSPDLVGELLKAIPATGASAAPRLYPPATARVAPPPASPLDAASVIPLPVKSSLMPDEVGSLDPSTLRLAFYDGREVTWTCAFTPLHGEALREGRCGERMRGAVSILRDDAPRAAGYIRTVHGRLDRFELVRPVANGDPEATPLPSSIETLALFGDQLVWVSWHHLYARDIGPAHSPLGAPVDLGEITGTAPEISACSTPSALLIGVKTFDKALAPGMSWRVMAAREGSAWQRTPGRSQVDVGATFTCEGHAATWTWFDRKIVTQVTCNRDRCETRTSDPMTLPWDVGGTLFAADLGGRAMILGLGTTPGPLMGRSVTSVLMRMAPLAAISKASDAVLFSDAAHEGAAVSAVSVSVRDGVALVLLKGEGPLPYRAIRVDSLGDFAPVLVED